MTKVKVGMDDPASVEFVERRRAGLERQVQMFSLLRPASFVPHLFYICADIFRESCLTHHYYKIQMCGSS